MEKKQILRVLDDMSPSDIKLKDLPRLPASLYNCSFNEHGQIAKRDGYSKYNTTSLGEGHGITGIHKMYQQDFTKEFLVAWNTKWYKLAATTPWAGTTLKSKAATDFTTTADQQTHFINFKNKVYAVNGKGLWKYDATYVETVGIIPPVAKPTGTSPAGGSVGAGNYKVKYTYIDSDGYESNGSPASDNIACAANDKIVLTVVNSTDSKVASRNIYRTTVGGSTYYYDKSIADNTTTTVDLTQADTTLMAGTELHTDHNVPPTTPHLICARRSRIMLAEDENTIASSIAEEYFPPELYFPAGNKQKVTGLMEQLNTLPVFTSDSLERLTNFDASNYEFKNAYSNEGCIATRSLCNCKNLLVYLGFDGIYYFNGTTGKKLNYQLNKYIMENINSTYAANSVGVYFQDKYLLTYPKGVSTVPNETVYYDFETQTYGVFNLGFSCYSVWDKGGDTYSLKAGSNTIGRVYNVFDGLDDDGAAITMYDDVQGIDLGMPDRYKKWFNIYIKVKTTSAATTAMRMYYTLDDNDEHYVSKTLDINTTKWYDIGFGSSGLRARSLGYRPYISDKYHAEIHGYALVFSLEPAKWGE